jgi:tetratricopeptide (TPR) repeat protein
MPENRNRKQVMVAGLLLALGTLAVYLPVLGLDFTNYDDTEYVTENPAVRAGLTWPGLAWAFSHFHSGNWHPLTWVSHMLDCQLFGLNPAGHHFTSLLFHSANTVALFLVLGWLTGTVWRSAMVAGLFALHPLHVESVAWIAERKDVLSTFFGLLSIWAYAKYVRIHASRFPHPFYLLALGCFALSLMSKPMLVTLPFVFLLIDFWPLGRLRFGPGKNGDQPAARLSSLLLEKIPLFALSAASCVVTFLAQKSGGAVASLQELPLGARAGNAVVSYSRYLAKTFWPAELAVIYPAVPHWPAGIVVLAIVILAATTAISAAQSRRRPYLIFGWAWFLGMLLPVIGLVQVGNHSIADRYTYLPVIGLFIMLSWGLAELTERFPPGMRPAVAMATKPANWLTHSPGRVIWSLVFGALVVLCGLITHSQLQYWRNTETLFRHALAVTGDNFVAWNSLGFFYAGKSQGEQARGCFDAAIAINPGNAFSWSGLARVSLDEGRYDDAINQGRAALKLDPRLADVHATLGRALAKQNKIDQAIVEYYEALRLRPDNGPAHYNLANVLAGRGQLAEARRHYQQALRLDPGSADGHNNLAYVLAQEGKLNESISEFRAALALNPALWQGHFGLAEALNRAGQTREAIEQYRQVLKERADFPEALNRLAWIQAVNDAPPMRDGAEAVRLAQRACDLTQNKQPIYVLTLAAAYAEAGRFGDAIDAAQKARALAELSGKTNLVRQSEVMVELFRGARPYREPALAPRSE